MDENQFYLLTRRSVIKYFAENADTLNPEDCDLCLRFLSDLYFEYCQREVKEGLK